jgi:hypothetical protein
MIGNNSLTLCAAEMHKAVEFYLKEEVMKDQAFKVISISPETSVSSGFIVKLEGTQKVPA